MVARLSPGSRHGRVFGGYGAFKSLGYATGPIVGSEAWTASPIAGFFDGDFH